MLTEKISGKRKSFIRLMRLLMAIAAILTCGLVVFLIDDKRNLLSRNSIFYRYFTVLYFYNSLIRELDFFYNAFTHLSFFQIFLLTTLSLFFIHKHLNSEVRQKTPTRIL